MNRFRLVCVVMGLELASGSAAAQNPVDFVREQAEPALRVFVGGEDACFVSRQERREGVGAAVLASIGQAAVQVGWKALTSYLETLAEGKSHAAVVGESGTFYRASRITRSRGGQELDTIVIEPYLACLSIVRGLFGSVDLDDPPRPFRDEALRQRLDPERRFVSELEGNARFATVERLGLVDFPDLYLEFHIETHPHEPVFRLDPAIIYYRKSATGEAGPNDLNITLSFLGMTAANPVEHTEDGIPVGSMAILPVRLRDLKPGSDYDPAAVIADRFWAPLPPIPDAAAQDALKERLSVAGPQSTTTLAPFNLLVTLEETSEPSTFFMLLSDFVGASESGVMTALSGAFGAKAP